ncbi:hypothetical protein P154DRAFT_560573 [Amniculicola lignicola CBS 123094]|uniref:Uncharacterized protein n=1 Tax=Amniculicola lignicola CBS 123094 TaxID=1392246 RepID=A0A6A5WRB9_9PLEO|nr:hypothetical protein P154DRAFT_560573 [Amniculicola lignicola CBS 123094]
MSDLNDKHVYQGLWVNEARGSVMGRTITTDTRRGAIVIAILAVLSTLGTTHLWHLLTFLVHQLRSNRRSADGLFRQQQTLFRTLPAPGSMLADHVKLWWSWRRSADQVLLRLFPYASLALLTMIASLSASILSSYVVDANDIQVLVKSPSCGPLDVLSTSGFETVLNYSTSVIPVAKTAGFGCYLQNSTGPECHKFIRPKVDFQPKETGCPFEQSICKKNTAAMILDSGLLNINDVFGLNLDQSDQIWYRRASTCTPLEIKDRLTTEDISTQPLNRKPFPGEEALVLHFGTNLSGAPNDTFATTTVKSLITSQYGQSQVLSFKSPVLAENYSSFEPITELEVPNADIFLLMVGLNNVQHVRPVDDPVFASHQTHTGPTDSKGTKLTIYSSDYPFGLIGCSMQYQFCLSGKESCTTLSNLPGRVSELQFPGPKTHTLSSLQQATLQLLITSSFFYDYTASDFVKTNERLSGGGLSRGLPPDQWKNEIIAQDSVVWAGLQVTMADYALGPRLRLPYAGDSPYARLAATEGEKKLCGMQRMRKSGGFVNINVFGLAFIITFSLFVTILDITLLRILIWLSRFKKALAPRIDDWVQEGVLQLQRRVYEAKREGTWTSLDDEIPVTEKSQLLSLITYTERMGEPDDESLREISKVMSQDTVYERKFGHKKFRRTETGLTAETLREEGNESLEKISR